MKSNPRINVPAVVFYLEHGKVVKEIAALVGCSDWAIWKFIQRHAEVRAIYVKTYTLRYPNKQEAPPKITIPLREAVQ